MRGMEGPFFPAVSSTAARHHADMYAVADELSKSSSITLLATHRNTRTTISGICVGWCRIAGVILLKRRLSSGTPAARVTGRLRIGDMIR